jgi:TatD DNase family protein
VERALAAGVEALITVGTGRSSSEAAVRLAEQYDSVYATVGIHPHAAEEADDKGIGLLRELAKHPRVVAIGEIGLDFYRDYAPREAQQTAFCAQLTLASEIGKPVVVHIRDKADKSAAYDTVLSILHEWMSLPDFALSAAPGVLHCYSGDLARAQRALDLGFYLGVDGPITFPSAGALRETVAALPLDRLLLETDCPFLAPQKVRGRRNEPAYLSLVAYGLARVHGTTVHTVAEVTSRNANQLFGLDAD